jgi:hypothetical protein
MKDHDTPTESTINKPKVQTNMNKDKADRLGAKTAPIDSTFVSHELNNLGTRPHGIQRGRGVH